MLDPAKTTIIVSGEEFVEQYHSKDNIFIPPEEEPLSVNDYAEVYKNPNEHIYYRGIRVGEYEKPFKYRYNLKDYVTLTEDRTIAYHFQIMAIIQNCVVTSKDKKFIRDVLTCSDSYQESKLDFSEVSIGASNEFNEVMAELRWERNTKVNSG